MHGVPSANLSRDERLEVLEQHLPNDAFDLPQLRSQVPEAADVLQVHAQDLAACGDQVQGT